MRYWLTAIAAAGLTITAGWIFLLNQADVSVRLTPSLTAAAPLGGMLLGAFALGAAAVGLLAAGGAIVRGWRSWGERRRARREANRRETITRVSDLVWTGETSAARAELRRAHDDPASEPARVALLAETHLQEGDPAAARDLVRRGTRDGGADPRLLDLLARASEELGDRPAAIDALERAYHAVPSSPRLAARLRDLYVAERRWRDAVALQAEVLLRLRAPARLAAERQLLVGLRYEATREEADHLRAARQLRALAREAPDFIPAWASAGDRYAQAGRAFAARRTWVRGLRRRAASPLLERIEGHDAAANRPQRTTRLLRSLLRRGEVEPVVALHLARHLLARGELDDAAVVLDGLPDGAASQVLRGQLARARGDTAAAADAFALAVGPGLGLDEPWRCTACQAVAAQWTARCDACGRWDALRSRAEEPGCSERSPASADLMRPAT